ncbi:MAG: hypothetical protein WC262_11065 [Bacteroidales bacterium]|jgi:hypothetical protein
MTYTGIIPCGGICGEWNTTLGEAAVIEEWTISRGDNGFEIEWWDDEHLHHRNFFEINDLQGVVSLLYWIKEQIVGDYNSKHRAENIIIKIEANDDL